MVVGTVLGCGPLASDDTGAPGESTGVESSADGPSSTTGPGSPMDGSSTGTTASADDTTSGASTSDGGACIPSPLGADCDDPCQCESQECFVYPGLGGVCSECDEAADCGEGCVCVGSPGGPASCSCEGSTLECVSDAGCPRGSWCTTVIEVSGVVTVTACSECRLDEHCAEGQLCAPVYDLPQASGVWSCVDPGSVPNLGGCDVDGSGDEQCASGSCASASVAGVPVLGICSECDEDEDCPGGTCVLPELAPEGESLVLMPGMCA